MDDTRASTAEPILRHVFELGPYTVNPATGELRGPAGSERLDPKVMAVLVFLAERAGEVVLREELLEKVWPGIVVTDDALSRCVYQLRRHLGRAEGSDRSKTLLETLPKRGYRLNCAARAPAAVSASPAPDTVRPGGRRRTATGLIVVAALLAAIGGSIAVIQRMDYFWRNPLANAHFTRLTEFDGAEQEAAISRDGRFVAFLSDRQGVVDAWITDVETGELRNLTDGRGGEMRNPDVRTVGFSPDGSEVTLWRRAPESSADPPPIRLWSVPSAGGPLRKYLDRVAEIAWSPDGRRSVYHPAESGDPLFVTEPNERVGRQIFVAPPGLHCHYPQWSPDGAFIYFVYGSVPDEMDVWRIAPTGGEPERITFHDSRVAYPVLLNARTLLYLATAEDGSGPWLHTMDVERRVARRIALGPQQYTSLAASADGRRLAATVTTQRTSLWRVPILADRVATSSDASRIEISTPGGLSPRLGRGDLLYRSPDQGNDSLWRLGLADGAVTKLWDGRRGRLSSAVAIDASGGRIAFAASTGRATRLYLMSGDGTAVRRLAEDLDVRGNPAWSPDGRWIAIAADRGGGAQLFKIPLTGARPVPLVDRYSIDPAWSPDGTFLLYRGAEAGPTFPVLAVTADGDARAVPSQILPRGSRRLAFLSDGKVVVLKGELRRKDFWLVDFDTGEERRLTDLGPEFIIDDFDVSADGHELVFDRLREESDVIMIEPAA